MSDHRTDLTDALDATAAAAAIVADAEAEAAAEAEVQADAPVAPAAPPPTLLRRVLARLHDLRHELGKFGTVGIVAYVFDFVTFNVCLNVANIETLASTTIATVVGATVAFIGNRFWTWRHREHSGLHREYALYFLVNLVGLVIGLGAVALSHYGLGSVWPFFQGVIADNVAKNIVGMGLGTLFRFWAYRTFVFREPDHPTS